MIDTYAPPIEVTTLERESCGWDEFVQGAAGASAYHEFRWKGILERTFGHRCHYLAAHAGGGLAGVLPLVEMKSVLFGHFLVSLPFVTYGGILARDAATQASLAAAAADLAVRLGAHHVELRQRMPVEVPWVSRRHKTAMVVRLPERIEDYWSDLSSRLRGKIRKAQRSGAAFTAHGAEGIAALYGVFARNMRDLGTPVYPLSFFRNIAESLPARSFAFVVRAGGRPAAAALGVLHGDELHLPWICSNYDYAKSHLNEFLYWSILEWAFLHGLRTVDLGRSTAGGGNYRFKQQWNPEEIPMHWYYWAPDGAPPPALSPDNPRFALAIRCWQKLPLAVANVLGPRVVRGIA
jgi:serine/alanine adding enzyme